MTGGLVLAGIEKAFSGIRVLKGVSFEASRGAIVGVVGENGAGKSTLMNVLGGVLQPDAGTLRLDGEVYAPRDPAEARALGVAFIHQELNLFPNLSVATNLALTSLPRRFGLVDEAALVARARPALARVGLDLDPRRSLAELGPGARQLVEIARALAHDARVVILDEPTTSLTRPEVERLFGLLQGLRAEGRLLLFISHALRDVRRLCDRIVVLRDGEVVCEGTPQDLPEDRLVSLMVGRALRTVFPARASSPEFAPDRGPGVPAAEPPPLELSGLSRAGGFRDVSFTVGRGEVVGLAGLLGAGRTELLRAIFGLDPPQGGEVRVSGRPFHPEPRAAIARGLCLVTEDRRSDGLVLDACVARNLELCALPRHARPWVGGLLASRLAAAAVEAARSVHLDPHARFEQDARTLSGGNQQKVVLGKWLLTRPKVLLLDEPTRGVDVGSKAQIHGLIRGIADGGAAVLLVSSEIEELLGLSDRILALRQGQLAGEWRRPALDAERILAACLGASR